MAEGNEVTNIPVTGMSGFKDIVDKNVINFTFLTIQQIQLGND